MKDFQLIKDDALETLAELPRDDVMRILASALTRIQDELPDQYLLLGGTLITLEQEIEGREPSVGMLGIPFLSGGVDDETASKQIDELVVVAIEDLAKNLRQQL